MPVMPPKIVMCALAASAFAITGCAGTKSPANEQTYDAVKTETLGMERPDWEGEKGGFFSSVFGGSSKEDKARQEEMQSQLARIERQMQQQQLNREQTPQPAPGVSVAPPAHFAGPVPKVAVITDGNSALAPRIGEAFSQSSQNYPVAVVSSAIVETQMKEYGCGVDSAQRCLQQLASYPGVRFLAVLSALRPAKDGQIQGQLQVHDATLGISYPARALTLPAVDGTPTQAALNALADDLLTRMLAANGVSPWITKTVSKEDNQWYVAAGKRSGLNVGDVLQVVSGGRLVSAPGGAPAGWIPGQTRGELRIKGFFGDDLAIAELAQGQPPQPSDVLLLKK